MRFLPGASVDLVLCDLPYGTTQNPWDSTLSMEALWAHYRRILTPRGVVALMSHSRFTAQVILSNKEWFKYKLVWVKSKATNFLNAKKQPLRKHEDICIFYRQQPPYSPQMFAGHAYDKGTRKNQLTGCYGDFRPARVQSEGSRYPTDVIYFPTAEAEGPVWHPTQKPVELGRYLVRTYTLREAVVLDHCFGSGSFLVAAAMEGRHSVGIEKNCDLAAFKKARINMIDVATARLRALATITLLEHERDLASLKKPSDGKLRGDPAATLPSVQSDSALPVLVG